MRAVALLSILKLKNSLRTLFSDPRKLIPALILLMALPGLIIAMTLSANQPQAAATDINIGPMAIRVGISVTMILLALSVIDSGLGDGTLAFSLPDVDYLFPSPISRRVVLAYRLPALLFGCLILSGFVIFLFRFTMILLQPKLPNAGHIFAPWWVPIAAIALAVGSYLNLATFLSVRIQDRRNLHKALTSAVFAGAIALGLLGWLRGLAPVHEVLQSSATRWLFLPSTLAGDTMYAAFAHRATGSSLSWLLFCYLLSLIPMFASNANWYEQSIVSTERISSRRKAARGGYASLMASKASSFKHKSDKPYTITPFGEGSVALFWAHLCAAWKRPFVNFIGPCVVGTVAGAFGAAANAQSDGLGYVGLFMIVMYSSMGFIGTAKTATESAIRRRELIAPLPISGWQSVAANLGVPYCAVLLFSIASGLTYSLCNGRMWPMVGFYLMVVMPLRLAPRMVLQSIVAIAYSDAADKIQQLLAQMVFWALASPFFTVEVLLCIPALVFRSIWLGLITVALFQLPFAALMLFLAGKATEKAIATGEPLRIFSILKT